MSELTAMLERQAAWQHARAGMSWTEKLRLAGVLRKAAVALRASGKASGVTSEHSTIELKQEG
jgi:hypothetical protein